MLTDSEELRWQIFDDLMALSERGARPLHRNELLSYRWSGQRLPLIDVTRGIRNKSDWDATLSIVTSERGPYKDRSISDGVWRYPYEVSQSTNATGPSNAKLRTALRLATPVLYFYSPRPNAYLLVGLVHVVEDDQGAREFTIALADLGVAPETLSSHDEDLRRWIRREVDQRLHQPRFRELVVPAYSHQCTVCELPIPRLLEAAHIRPDRDATYGQPEIYNGLSLCRNHHRAFDRHLIGIDPDLKVHVHRDLARMPPTSALEQTLLRFDGTHLKRVPTGTDHPSTARLAITFTEFESSDLGNLAQL